MTKNPAIPPPLLPAVAAALLAGCGLGAAQPADTGALPEVLTVQARPAPQVRELRLPARALASESARLYPRAAGFVSERRADLGDRVQAGQVLALIVAPEVDEAVREAQAEAARARADLELATSHYDRAAELVTSGAISREMYGDRSANRAAAAAALAVAESRLANVRERQAFLVVRAPFTGIVSARNVERGDRVVGDSSTASTPLFEVSALDPLRIVVDVPQSAALRVHAGLDAEVFFSELPDERFVAQVERTARSISADAGGMRVELRLDNPDERIPAGMVGEVRLRLPRARPAALLPVAAVVQGAGTAHVARLGDDSVLEYRTVTLGRNLGNEIEVLDGLSPGDTVVLAPNALLAEGSRVRARTVPAP